jgi:hypothetical protein
VGQANFDWIIKEVADLAIDKAKEAPKLLDLKWSTFLGRASAAAPAKKTAAKKAPVKKTPAKKKASPSKASS